MSWMDVQGKIYHCLECGASIPVEHEGGRRPTQVSDLVVWEQMELAGRHGGSDDYLHEEGLCPGCVDALEQREAPRSPAAKIAKLHAELVDLASSLQRRIFDAIQETAGEWLERLTQSELRSIDPAAFSTTLGKASRDSAPEEIHELACNYLEQSNNALGGVLREHLHQATGLAEMEEEYAGRVGPLIDRLVAVIDKVPMETAGLDDSPAVVLFFAKDTSARESLNPLVEYEATVRQPVDPGSGTFFVSTPLAQTQLNGMAKAFLPENVTSIVEDVLAQIIAGRIAAMKSFR